MNRMNTVQLLLVLLLLSSVRCYGEGENIRDLRISALKPNKELLESPTIFEGKLMLGGYYKLASVCPDIHVFESGQ